VIFHYSLHQKYWISACFSLLHAPAGMKNITQGMRMSFRWKRESRRFSLHKYHKEALSLGLNNRETRSHG